MSKPIPVEAEELAKAIGVHAPNASVTITPPMPYPTMKALLDRISELKSPGWPRYDKERRQSAEVGFNHGLSLVREIIRRMADEARELE